MLAFENTISFDIDAPFAFGSALFGHIRVDSVAEMWIWCRLDFSVSQFIPSEYLTEAMIPDESTSRALPTTSLLFAEWETSRA